MSPSCPILSGIEQSEVSRMYY